MEPDVDALSLLQTRAEKLMPAKQAQVQTQAHGKQAPRNLRQKAATSRYSTSGMVRLLDFTKAEIVVNNLGGQGPQKTLATGEPAPKEIRFKNLVQGQDVDLIITTPDGYTPYNPERNGILGGNGQINAESGSVVPLTFSFVHEGTDTPFVLPKFYITFSDIDERHGGSEKETIAVDGFA